MTTAAVKPAGFTPLLSPHELTSTRHSGGVMASSINTRGLPALAFVGLGLPELDPKRGQDDVKADVYIADRAIERSGFYAAQLVSVPAEPIVELAGIRYPSKRRTAARTRRLG